MFHLLILKLFDTFILLLIYEVANIINIIDVRRREGIQNFLSMILSTVFEK